MTAQLRIALTRGVQLALLACVAAKYQFDRSTDPHVQIKVRPIDPDSPLKGRYLTLQVEAPASSPNMPIRAPVEVSLSARDGRLEVTPSAGGGQFASLQPCGTKSCWVLHQPLAFFIPEHANPPGGSVPLWVDATLPGKGPPRPVGLLRELGDGHFTPLDLN